MPKIPRLDPFSDEVEAFRKKLAQERASAHSAEEIAQVIADNKLFRDALKHIYVYLGPVLARTKERTEER